MQNDNELRKIIFEVTTMAPLPAGEQVFIAGDHPALGQWDPDGIPLTRVADNLWSRMVLLPAGRRIEYKITRGAWNSEEARADERIPDNYSVPAAGEHLLAHVVHHWKDHRLGPPPRITGDYRIHEAITSPRLRFPHKVIVWLPPSYEKEMDRRYPVLYMQDGQQVFDPTTSTWNQDWEVDEWCTKLIAEGRLQEIIVVAVYSTDDRCLEYNPSQVGKEYAQFIVEELKPMVDQEYRTLPDRAHTAVAGSSMGATIAFHMAWTRPDVFFGTACLSPAFKFKDDPSDLDLVRATSEPPPLRVFLYCGAGDELEQELLPGTREMADLLRRAGFKDGQNLLVVEEPQDQHNEAAWARQTDRWLMFLFGK
ncbi:MAG: hypothetical protein JXB04_11100 [Kiritimatiellae bacterium]|nr:hypothetical protein [Kiritimatiellia bacterium]